MIKQPFRSLSPHLKHLLNIVSKIEGDDLRIEEWENFPYHLVGIQINAIMLSLKMIIYSKLVKAIQL